MSQKIRDPMEKSIKFFMSMFAVFLDRVKPASTRAKPGCMNMTSTAAIRIQMVSIETVNSDTAVV
jgi:hypothetical protein